MRWLGLAACGSDGPLTREPETGALTTVGSIVAGATTEQTAFERSVTSAGPTISAAQSDSGAATNTDDAAVGDVAPTCGEPGNEFLTDLQAVDLETGTTAWFHCPEQAMSGIVLGRVVGVTLVWERAEAPMPNPHYDLVAFADDGSQLWTRRGDADGRSYPMLGEEVLVYRPASGPSDAAVIGIDVRTGGQIWSHPFSEGAPFGIAKGVVVELVGGPDMSPPLPAEPETTDAVLRGIDALTGKQRWETPVQVVKTPRMFSLPAVGDEVVTVQQSIDETVLFGVGTGRELRRVPGLFDARDNVLSGALGVDPNDNELRDPRTGELVLRGAWPLPSNDTEHVASADRALVAIPAAGSNVSLAFVELATGTIVWSVPDGSSLRAMTAEWVAVATEHEVRLLDLATGTEQWRYRVSPLGSGVQGVFGNGVLLVRTNLPGTG